MKKKKWKYILLFSVLALYAEAAMSQSASYKVLHEVKRKETLFGIAQANGLTVEELVRANPEMNTPGYELKKGTVIRIPYPSTPAVTAAPAAPQAGRAAWGGQARTDVRYREVRVGVVLPLHNDNGDGRRMVEYYRGVLMACDSLRSDGISVDIRAWNLPEGGGLSAILSDPHAADRDLLIGPLYTRQVRQLSDFAAAHDIRLLIPFSISSSEVNYNGSVFQAFQNGNQLNEAYTYHYMQLFKGCHTVIIDCNDSTTTKGPFTRALRRKLDQEGIIYSITNLKSSEEMFSRCFSTTMRNIVVLNTSRSAELNVAFAKLNGLLVNNPALSVTMFGYTEWLMYSRQHLENFYKFDTYIPSTYYMNPLLPRTEQFKRAYYRHFRQEMQPYHQRFAATGFDHAFFMIKGLHLFGTRFTGAAGMVGYTPLQTPLQFERIGNGGLQNRSVTLVHYMPSHRVETLRY